MTAALVPLGKYKGQPLEVLAGDPEYVKWLIAQPWFKERYSSTYNLIINNYGEPSETPEHNALQAKFLSRRFCLAFVIAAGTDLDAKFQESVDYVDAGIKHLQQHARNKIDRVEYPDGYGKPSKTVKVYQWDETFREEMKKQAESLKLWRSHPKFMYEISREFEDRGADVEFSISISPEYEIADKIEYNRLFRYRDVIRHKYRIELKPTLGDDYPAVIRQMKRSGSRQLVVDNVDLGIVTYEDMVSVFAHSAIQVIRLSKINECLAIQDAVVAKWGKRDAAPDKA